MPLHCGNRRCDDSETGLLIGAKRPHPQPPCANNPAPRLLRRRLLGTIEEYIRLRGLQPRQRADQARTLLQQFLDAAKTHRNRVETLDLQGCGLNRTDWLCVLGVDCQTRVHLKVKRRGKSTAFLLSSDDRKNDWNTTDNDRRHLTGDGTVPFEGAVPGFLPRSDLVCVSPSDFGYWEAFHRTTNALAGFHGILPNMNMLHRLIVRHITGNTDRHGNTWGRRPPGVSRHDWTPPLRGLRDRPNN